MNSDAMSMTTTVGRTEAHPRRRNRRQVSYYHQQLLREAAARLRRHRVEQAPRQQRLRQDRHNLELQRKHGIRTGHDKVLSGPKRVGVFHMQKQVCSAG